MRWCLTAVYAERRNALLARGLSETIIDDIVLKCWYIDDVIKNNQMMKAIETVAKNPKFQNVTDINGWLSLDIVSSSGIPRLNGEPAKTMIKRFKIYNENDNLRFIIPLNCSQLSEKSCLLYTSPSPRDS